MSIINLRFDPPDLALRPATPADYPFLSDLHQQAFAALVVQVWEWDEARLEEDFRSEYTHPGRCLLLYHDQPVGSSVIENYPSFYFLDYLAILPAYQNHGLGTRFVRALLAAAARQLHPVRLHVIKVNPAVQLYKRLGFLVQGEDEYRYYMEALLKTVHID